MEVTQASMPIIGIHLDMKGIIFRPGYIPQLMTDLASQGINAVLVEYEDIFPFDGLAIAYDPSSVWSRKTLQTFRREAAKNNIEIIPLQQCLGHLEYVFRWKKYLKFAEKSTYPSTLKLSDDTGKALIKEMLRQVMEAHPESRYIHLGMDEATDIKQTAERLGCSVLELFIAYVEELTVFAESYGKTPIIWSDMLEDNFAPDLFDGIKDRVVLATWDYGNAGEHSKLGRMHGWRVSKEWINEPENTEAPAISMGSRYFEDLAEYAQQQIAPFRHGREIDSFYPVKMWTKLGFRVLGVSAIRTSSDGPILPGFTSSFANISGFAHAIKRQNQLGLIGSSWARGNTTCWPNLDIDLTWPCISKLGESMGAQQKEFFPGIPKGTLDLLFAKISRCKKDWAIEGILIEEMERLKSQMTAHQYEWQSLQLMLRVLALYRRVDLAYLEVDRFRAARRPFPSEWQRRLKDERRLVRELKTLRTAVKKHFGRRNAGVHFEEWLANLFDVPIEKLIAYQEVTRSYINEATKRYGW